MTLVGCKQKVAEGYVSEIWTQKANADNKAIYLDMDNNGWTDKEIKYLSGENGQIQKELEDFCICYDRNQKYKIYYYGVGRNLYLDSIVPCK